MLGSACGRLNFRNICQREARIDRARSIMSVSIDLKPITGGYDDGEESEQERRDHLGENAEAEPDHEQWRDRDLRDALGENEQWIDKAFDQPRVRDNHCDRNSKQYRQPKPPSVA
jgi:hypothetical protein